MTERDTMGHEAVDGSHSHAHSPYGTQGGDGAHGHVHVHHGDSTHEHDHVMAIPAVAASAFRPPFGASTFIAAATVPSVEASAAAPPPFDLRGAAWGVEQRGDGWQVLTAAGEWENPAGSYAEALGLIAEQLAGQTGDTRPVLNQRWRSAMAPEGAPTSDSRRISPGAIGFRDCPLPLMLQTVTDSGHMGAVLAGAIEATGMVGQMAMGSGTFDATDAGRQSVSIIDARGRFGVSIDVCEADGEFECTETDPDSGECIDGEMVFSRIVVFGLTMTPFPAFSEAFIEFDAQAASVAASADCVDCGDATAGVTDPSIDVTVPPVSGGPEMQVTVTPHVSFSFAAQPLVAAGGPSAPPASWFDDPQFGGSDDPRVVRQPDGQYLCPLTVTADGHVFGHFAGWNTCHTAYSAACVTPPRSQTGYAAFMLRPLLTEEGDVIQVGHISMGCGHIDDDGTVPLRVVRDHYDGGPGAVLMARVRVGEDAHGGWFAGSVAEDVTDAQVRKFSSLSVSGHWREVWRGKGLDLLACVAGVPVPGFPVSAMAAAGFVPAETDVLYRLPDPRVVLREGRPVVLVAAGVVRQPFPWERVMAAQQNQIEALSRRLDRAERITAALRPVVATGLREPFAGTDVEPEPTPPRSLLANAANGRRH